MKENVPILEILKQFSEVKLNVKNAKIKVLDSFLTKIKHAYEWTFNVSENNNDVMVDAQLVMGSKINL
jgi:hypothetical protein